MTPQIGNIHPSEIGATRIRHDHFLIYRDFIGGLQIRRNHIQTTGLSGQAVLHLVQKEFHSMLEIHIKTIHSDGLQKLNHFMFC